MIKSKTSLSPFPAQEKKPEDATTVVEVLIMYHQQGKQE
jgi:hypothetical protein